MLKLPRNLIYLNDFLCQSNQVSKVKTKNNRTEHKRENKITNTNEQIEYSYWACYMLLTTLINIYKNDNNNSNQGYSAAYVQLICHSYHMW